MKTVLSLIALTFLLSGCSYLDVGRGYAGEGTAYAVRTECGLSVEQRQANLAAINDSLAEMGETSRAMALDCDGDGASDF